MIRRFSSVINRQLIYSQVNSILNSSSSVEYLYTKPQWIRILSLNSSVNPYGHALVQYDHPEKGKTVMNICGKSGDKLVNFFPADDYMFTGEFPAGNEQGGIFNRSFIGSRIENIEPNKIVQLHDYYTNLQKEQEAGKVVFTMADHLLTNSFRRFVGFPIGGNCSYWTSEGLRSVGLINRTSSFPMFLLLKFLMSKRDLDQINIVSYRSISYNEEPKWMLVHPYYRFFIDLRDIWHYDKFANIVIEPTYDGWLNRWTIEVIYKKEIKDKWLNLRQKLENVISL
jgi:hypothetical protein